MTEVMPCLKTILLSYERPPLRTGFFVWYQPNLGFGSTQNPVLVYAVAETVSE